MPSRPSSARKDTPSFDSFVFAPAKIKKVVTESPKVKSFYLEHHGAQVPRPGQFFMVWLPGQEEIPISVSDAGDDFVRISVANQGQTTAEFHKLKSGDELFLRGPFGNGFSLEGKSFLLIGGGYGAAPIAYAAKTISRTHKKCTYLIGAKSRAELLFVKESRKLGVRVEIATEDGSFGHHGLVTDLMASTLKKGNFESVLTCGPELMMYGVVSFCAKRGIKVQASLERYMKCGFGVCGSCVLDPIGLRVCSDGPVFNGALLLKTEFGKRKRDASGTRVAI